MRQAQAAFDALIGVAQRESGEIAALILVAYVNVITHECRKAGGYNTRGLRRSTLHSKKTRSGFL